MVFVLDNYDSFTYNLVQYIGELGEEVVVKRNDELTPEEIVAMNPDRILLSPGPCVAWLACNRFAAPDTVLHIEQGVETLRRSVISAQASQMLDRVHDVRISGRTIPVAAGSYSLP